MMVVADPFTASTLPLYSQISPENTGEPFYRLLPMSTERVEPLNKVSDSTEHRVDESVHGLRVRFDGDDEKHRKLKEEICERLKTIARKEGTYNSDKEFSPPPYTGLIVDIYC